MTEKDVYAIPPPSSRCRVPVPGQHASQPQTPILKADFPPRFAECDRYATTFESTTIRFPRWSMGTMKKRRMGFAIQVRLRFKEKVCLIVPSGSWTRLRPVRFCIGRRLRFQ